MANSSKISSTDKSSATTTHLWIDGPEWELSLREPETATRRCCEDTADQTSKTENVPPKSSSQDHPFTDRDASASIPTAMLDILDSDEG